MQTFEQIMLVISALALTALFLVGLRLRSAHVEIWNELDGISPNFRAQKLFLALCFSKRVLDLRDNVLTAFVITFRLAYAAAVVGSIYFLITFVRSAT